MPKQTPTADNKRFYYANDEKIVLEPSRRFVAMRGVTEDKEVSDLAATAAARISAAARPVDVLNVPEYGLAVFAVGEEKPGQAAAAVPAGEVGPAALTALVEEEAELVPGPTVYQTPDYTGAEGLIPVGEILVLFKPEATEQERQRLLKKHKLEIKQTDYPEPGGYLVAVEDDEEAIELANALHDVDIVEYAEPNFVHLSTRVDEMPNVTADGEGEMITETSRIPETLFEAPLEEAELPTVEELAAPQALPTDPGFTSQWALKKIRAPEAWQLTRGHPGISVAVIDEGCDMAHEDIAYKLPGYDAFAQDNDPQPSANDAHGTACSGVVAMRFGNAKGGIGVAPNCKVMPIRIAKGIGGGFWSTSSAKAADGIRKAVDSPRSADILSNSYGLGASTAVTSAFNYAQAHGRGGKGCPIAAAAGNTNSLGVIYPARLSPMIPGFLAVSATNQWDERKSKTSQDPEHWWGSTFGPEVDVAAPGVQIYTTDIMGGTGYGAGNYVPDFNGTSSATPHVAGLMALILSVDPALRSWEVEDLIKLTALDLGPSGRDPEFGFGRIDCRKALEAALKLWFQIKVQPVFLGKGAECYMRIFLRMFNSGINTVRLDSMTLTSHIPNWGKEIDRFEYRPNPGGLMKPRTNEDVRFNRILLRANGNKYGWSYRWRLSWSYTFWRPQAPGFPLEAPEVLSDAEGEYARVEGVRGQGASPETAALELPPTEMESLRPFEQAVPLGVPADEEGDLIKVDRTTRAITITIR